MSRADDVMSFYSGYMMYPSQAEKVSAIFLQHSIGYEDDVVSKALVKALNQYIDRAPNPYQLIEIVKLEQKNKENRNLVCAPKQLTGQVEISISYKSEKVRDIQKRMEKKIQDGTFDLEEQRKALAELIGAI